MGLRVGTCNFDNFNVMVAKLKPDAYDVDNSSSNFRCSVVIMM